MVIPFKCCIIRFLLTYLFFVVSVGGGGYVSEKLVVTDAQKVVGGEIWSVTVCTPRFKEIFYVLEATCEVIGHSMMSLNTSAPLSNPISLRADWSAYINHRISPSLSNIQLPSLLEHLKWTNHEEYNRGISRFWLNKTQGEGELGTAKRVVAERYILACVVGNRCEGSPSSLR